ncbi:hypothetical protein DUNSADRAFT_6460 [Dunaliella salina]|uniref:Encoded protein n=1 Tax=Dunaliella salina TaxID=3046 RepID=A0ABQ7GNF2_DUNSA|nr:hypothetical protein DUNSADRAFT_6460 [Dunaliella salina]|eukprot:KAF5836089.1 hypothetical protein DUNSADRAFT_6460 [Dunaliella salina]
MTTTMLCLSVLRMSCLIPPEARMSSKKQEEPMSLSKPHFQRSISYPTGKFDTRAIWDEIFSLLVPQVPAQPQASSSALDILHEKFPTINLAKEDAGKLLELLNGGTQCESFGQTQDPTDV